jgi:hypothetical protein
VKATLLAVMLALLLPRTSFAASPQADAAAPDSVTHVPGSGFRLVTNPAGTLNFRLYFYVRYLNERTGSTTTTPIRSGRPSRSTRCTTSR